MLRRFPLHHAPVQLVIRLGGPYDRHLSVPGMVHVPGVGEDGNSEQVISRAQTLDHSTGPRAWRR